MKPQIVIDERLRIGTELKALRESKGISMRQLEAMTGISNSHIARIEAGRYSTGIDIIAAIAAALDAKIRIE